MAQSTKEKPCTCAGCSGLPSADPVWGFDRAKVPTIKCLHCKGPIGDEPYICDAAIARFGAMSFMHERCSSNPAKDRKQLALIASRQGYKHSTSIKRNVSK